MDSITKDSEKETIAIPKHLECSICGDLFDKAVSLKACGHTYCSVCIRNHWQTTSLPGVHHQSKKECPMCRTSVGYDVNKALVINREIQQAAKEFKFANPEAFESTNLPPTLHAKIVSCSNESPIQKRIQPRNYAGMRRSGRKDLIKICKEYNLPTSGNDQELVDRLRSFECMWNAELDTVDTPLRPSELVAKFKEKERKQREAKSKEMFNGTNIYTKHLKKMTSSLLDNKNKRNDRRVNQTSSGNVSFDAEFKSGFKKMIATARRHLKKDSNWSLPRKTGPRTYADDGIHDSPKRNANIVISLDSRSATNISAAINNANTLERTAVDDPIKSKSTTGGNEISQIKKRRHIHNPYKSERKKSIQNPYTRMNTTQSSLNAVTHSRPSPPRKEAAIFNLYKKQRLLQHQTTKGGNSGSRSLPLTSASNMQESKCSYEDCRDRIPLARANNLNNLVTDVHHNNIDEGKIPRRVSTEGCLSSGGAQMSSINSARKRIIRNPYAKSSHQK